MAPSGRNQEAAPGSSAKGGGDRLELSRHQQSVARRVAESKATVPHLYLSRGLALAARPSAPLAAVLAAAARALADDRRLNSSYRDGVVTEHERINIGVTVETAAGSILPVLVDADKRSLVEIESELERLDQRAHEGSLASPERAGGTFTISAIDAGADSLLPAVVPGQAAHLGIGRVREAAIVHAGSLLAGYAIDLTLACDHRVVGPDAAAEFLAAVAATLEAPEQAGR